MPSGCSFRLRLGSGGCGADPLAAEAVAGLAARAEETKTDCRRYFCPGKLECSRAEPVRGFRMALSHLPSHVVLFRSCSQTLACFPGIQDDLLDIGHKLGVMRAIAKLFQKWLNLGKHCEHLVGESRSKKCLFAQGAVENERRSHSPIRDDLAQRLHLRRSVCHLDSEVVGSRARPELLAPPSARFAHFGLFS